MKHLFNKLTKKETKSVPHVVTVGTVLLSWL